MTVVLKLGRARSGGRVGVSSHTGNLFSFQVFVPLSMLVGAFALATGCEEGSPSPRAEALGGAQHFATLPSSPHGPAATGLDLDAGEIEAKIDPPAPPGNLQAEIAGFTTLDACVKERAKLDPIVGDALEAIGYETFLRDACRVLDATKASDPKRCAAIDASSLEARCRATVAQVTGNPEGCPWEAAIRHDRGRDARCVAMASRDPRLCAAAADELERATCDATFSQDLRPCATLRAPSDASRCKRDAERWRGIVATGPSPSTGAAPMGPRPFAVTETLRVAGTGTVGPDTASASSANGATLEVDLTTDVARGVTVVERRDGARIAFGPLTEAGVDFIAPSPHTRASLALELSFPDEPASSKEVHSADARGGDFDARVERVELLLPGRAPVSTPGARSTLVAHVDVLSLSRASPIHVEVNGDLVVAGSSWHVHAEATTFVRDVVKSSDLDDLGELNASTRIGRHPGTWLAAGGQDAGIR